MPASRFDLVGRKHRFEHGAHWLLAFEWKQDDGSPIDLTGWSGRLSVARRKGVEPALVLTSLAEEITLGNDGAVACLATPEQVAALDFESGVWELVLTSPTDKVTRLLEGEAEVSWEVGA